MAPTLASARRWALALVMGGSALVAFQGGFLRVALPVIRTDLDASIATVQLISVAGLGVTTATVVASGRLADLLGARRVYRVGLVVFAAGGALSSVAPSAVLLVAAQAGQGLGWSLVAGSATPALVRTFTAAERGRVVAAGHVAVAVGLAAGPALGGVLTDGPGWRSGLRLVAGAAVLVAVMVHRRFPPDPTTGGRPRFDWAGSGALGLGLATLLLALGGPGLAASSRIQLLVLAGATFGAFVWVQARSSSPTIELGLFAHRAFTAGLASAALVFVAMAANMFLMPFFLQEGLGFTASRAGMVLVAVPVGVVVAAPLAGAIADRMGPRTPATAGTMVIAGAIATMAGLDASTSAVSAAVVLLAYGLGAGLFQSPNISGVLGSVPDRHLGVASGTLSTLGRLGQVMGVVLAGALWSDRASGAPPGSVAAAGEYRVAFLVLAGAAGLAAVTSWLRGSGRPPGRHSLAEVD